MTFKERLEILPEWVLYKMFVFYRNKPFSYKNRTILSMISEEQNDRVLKRYLDFHDRKGVE